MSAQRDLIAGALEVQSRHMDWSEGFGETWESYEVSPCDECGQLVTSANPTCHGPEDGEGHPEYEVSFDGPMMNYFYALPDFKYSRAQGSPEKAAELIKDYPLCVVQLLKEDDEDSTYGLALTGGGMDLSWEICAAYVALGYVPPRFAWRLPQMSGYKMTATRRATLRAIRYGIAAVEAWIAGDKQRVREASAYLRKNSAKKGA